MVYLGCAAFLAFFWGDINDWKLHQKWLSWLFPAGVVLLAISVIAQSSISKGLIHVLWIQILVLGFGAFSLWMLIKCLFFSFPAKDAYIEPGKTRAVCTDGQYGICRHPGVWWLFFLMLSLNIAAGLPLSSLMIYTVLNLLLVLFEDRIVFPSVLSGYVQYCRKVPMLVPCFNHAGMHSEQEMEKK